MNYRIKVSMGHYALYIDGKFYGNYDTYREAEIDAENLIHEGGVI